MMSRRNARCHYWRSTGCCPVPGRCGGRGRSPSCTGRLCRKPWRDPAPGRPRKRWRHRSAECHCQRSTGCCPGRGRCDSRDRNPRSTGHLCRRPGHCPGPGRRCSCCRRRSAECRLSHSIRWCCPKCRKRGSRAGRHRRRYCWCMWQWRGTGWRCPRSRRHGIPVCRHRHTLRLHRSLWHWGRQPGRRCRRCCRRSAECRHCCGTGWRCLSCRRSGSPVRSHRRRGH